MLTNNITNTNLLSSLIVSELKEIGIKHKEKKIKVLQNKNSQRVFRQALHLVQLTDAFLANGTVVQVPKFLAEACSSILEQVEVEGIFRKAGSAAKQREIRKYLEAGLPLGKSHRVVDIANILSYFFRELPEPLIPTYIHETLVRCLLTDKANRIRAIQLACLLPPTLTVHTLAYFTQFLHTVSAHADINKMSAENLAIVLAPSVMPHADINSVRFKNHIKVVQLLIENANLIGTIPAHISDLVHNTNALLRCPVNSLETPRRPLISAESGAISKKKKRRSEMFNGLRKIVGSAIGSSENLDCSAEATDKVVVVNTAINAESSMKKHLYKQNNLCSALSSQKRKFTDPVCTFAAKKKKDLLVPTSGMLPNCPLIKKKKDSRISLGNNRQTKNNVLPNTATTSAMERRWSLVSTGWTKYKKRDVMSQKTNCDIFEKEKEYEIPTPEMLTQEPLNNTTDSDNIRISKSEYEEIKQRVANIESQISEEFGDIHDQVLQSSLVNTNGKFFSSNGTETVQTKYEKTVMETEALTCQSTEQLAQRLSRGLKIRRSVDQQVIRSPSARKIGTLRRRSQERTRITRTKTWHLSGTGKQFTQSTIPAGETPKNLFLTKTNIKLRPKTLQYELATPQKDLPNQEVEIEEWMPAEAFFQKDVRDPNSRCRNMEEKSISQLYNSFKFKSVLCTPTTKQPPLNDFTPMTPMLPPKSIPRKFTAHRTPHSLTKIAQTNSLASTSRLVASTPIDEDNGRASIARLRTQNAGMVLAKAKLFDGLNDGIGSSVSGTDVKSDILGSTVKDKKSVSYKTRVSVNTLGNLDSKSINLAQLQNESPKVIYKRTTASKKPQSAMIKHTISVNEILKENVLVSTKDNSHIARMARTPKESNNKSSKAYGDHTPKRQISINSPKKFHFVNSDKLNVNFKSYKNTAQANKSSFWK